MDCTYKYKGEDYSLEDLKKKLISEINPTELVVNTSTANVITLAVLTNPAYTQFPYVEESKQLAAFNILANHEGSVQKGSVLSIRRVDKKEHALKYGYTAGVVQPGDSQYVFEVYDELGNLISNLREISTHNKKNADPTVQASYINNIANLEKSFINGNEEVLVKVSEKSTGIELNENKASTSEANHTVDDLIGDDVGGKLVNINNKAGQLYITLDGVSVEINKSNLNIDLKNLGHLISPKNEGFLSVILLPSPVREHGKIKYVAFTTRPTKIFSETDPKKQYPAFTNTVKEILKAVITKDFSIVSQIGIDNDGAAYGFLNKFFLNVNQGSKHKDLIFEGVGVNKKFDIDKILENVNIVLTYTKDDQPIMLLGDKGVEGTTYKRVTQKLHKTGLNYSTNIKGKPRTYFTNPQVGIDIANTKVKQGTTPSPSVQNSPVPTPSGNTVPVVENLIVNVSKRYESLLEFAEKRRNDYELGEFQADGSSVIWKLNSEGVVIGKYLTTYDKNFIPTGREFKSGDAVLKEAKANGITKELKNKSDKSRLVADVLIGSNVKRLETLIEKVGIENIINDIRTIEGGKYNYIVSNLKNATVDYYINNESIIREYLPILEDLYDSPKEEIQTAGTTIGGKTLAQLNTIDKVKELQAAYEISSKTEGDEYYSFLGKLYERVTTYLKLSPVFKNNSTVTNIKNASPVGDYFDTFGRLFFEDNNITKEEFKKAILKLPKHEQLAKINTDLIYEETLKHFQNAKSLIEKQLGDNNLTFMTTEIFVHRNTPIKDNPSLAGVAGTLDMLVIDSNGNPYIFDFKTVSENKSIVDHAKLITPYAGELSYEQKWGKQQSLYAQIISDTLGVIPQVYIVVIPVTYSREEFTGDFKDVQQRENFKPQPSNVKISNNLFIKKLYYKENTSLNNTIVSAPPAQFGSLTPSGTNTVFNSTNKKSSALDTEQLERIINLTKDNDVVTTVDIISSMANFLAGEVLRGESLKNAKEKLKTSITNNNNRAKQLTIEGAIEAHYLLLEEQEKDIRFNELVVEKTNLVLENFEEYFDNSLELLKDLKIDENSKGFSQNKVEEGDESEDDLKNEDDEDLDTSDMNESEDAKSIKIHSKSEVEHDHFSLMDVRVKAFLSTVSVRLTNSLNLGVSYGSEKLSLEISEIIKDNPISTNDDFIKLIKTQSHKDHILDFIYKFENLSLENQNSIVGHFSLAKNNFVTVAGDNVFDSDRSDVNLQLSNYLDNFITDNFLDADDNLTSLAEKIRDMAKTVSSEIVEDVEDANGEIMSISRPLTPDEDFGRTLEFLKLLGLSVPKDNMNDAYYKLMNDFTFVSLQRKFLLFINKIENDPRKLKSEMGYLSKFIKDSQLGSIFFTSLANSFVNKDGNRVYFWSVPNIITEVNRRAALYIGYLKNNAFSQFTNLLSGVELNKTKPSDINAVKLGYFDGIDGKSFGALSIFEKLKASMSLYINSQFKSNEVYPSLTFANSDKKLIPFLQRVKNKYDKKSAIETFKKFLKAEVARMVFASKNTVKTEGFNANNFYLFPELNKDEEFDLGFQKGNSIDTLALEDSKLEEKANQLFEKYFKITKEGLGDYQTKDEKGSTINLSDDVIINFMMNEMNNKFDYMVTYSNDPAFAYKNSVKGTLSQFFKRLASNIATAKRVPNMGDNKIVCIADSKESSSELESRLSRLDGVTLEEFNTMLIEDPNKAKSLNAYPYYKMSIADAQGYITFQKYLDILLNQNKIKKDKYDELSKIISETTDITKLEFTDAQLEGVLIQAIKPLITGDVMVDGLLTKNYIKLSSFPILPQLFKKDSKMMEYAKFMHDNGVTDIVNKSAYKIGSPPTLNSLSEYNEADHLRTLPNYFFGVQQEIPYDENKLKMLQGSQILKLLFNTLDKPELKEEFYDLQSELVNKYLTELKDLLGISVNTDDDVNVDYSKLRKTLIKEFKKKGINPQDIENFNVENNKFSIPLFFNSLGGKIETAIFNMFSKMSKNKLGGKSYVLISDEGFDINTDVALTTSSYDAKKGLQPMRIDKNGKVLPAQILLTWDFQDKDGNILDINDFRNENGELDLDMLPQDLLEGLGYRIPSQGHNSMAYIEIVGFLPKYMGASVVAPKDFIAQMGSDFDIDKLYIHKRTYKYFPPNENYLGKNKNNGRFAVSVKKISDKTDTEPAVYEPTTENKIIDIYIKVLSSPDVFDKITKPLDFGNLHDVANDIVDRQKARYENNLIEIVKYEEALNVTTDPYKIEELKGIISDMKSEILTYNVKNNLSILHPLTQAHNYDVGVIGQDCISRSSLLSVFSSIVSGSGLALKPRWSFTDSATGKVVYVGFSPKVKIGDAIHVLDVMDSSKPLIKSPNSVEKTENDVISSFQSASVDNINELLLDKINYNPKTHDVLTGMVKLRLDSKFISYFLTNPEFVKLNNNYKSGGDIHNLPPLNYDKLQDGTESADVVMAYAKFFNELGLELNNISSTINMTSKGYGKNIADYQMKLKNIPTEFNTIFVDNLDNVLNLPYFSIAYKNLDMFNNFIEDIFDLNKDTFRKYKSVLSGSLGYQSSKKNKAINSFFKSFIYSRANSIEDNDLKRADVLRSKLLFGENSMQKQVMLAKKEDPDNILTKYLFPHSVTKSNSMDADLITNELFKIENPLELLSWKLTFEKSYFDENDKYHTLVKNLVDYTYLIGGIQDSHSIVGVLPSKVVREYQKGLFTDDLLMDGESKLSNNIALQFCQHFPEHIDKSQTLPEGSEKRIAGEPTTKPPQFVAFIDPVTNLRSKVGYLIGSTESAFGKHGVYDLYDVKGYTSIREITLKPSQKFKRNAGTVNPIFEKFNFESESLKSVLENVIENSDSTKPIIKNLKFLNEIIALQGDVTIKLSQEKGGINKGTYGDGVITLYSENIKTVEELLEILTHETSHSIVNKYFNDFGELLRDLPENISTPLLKIKRLQASLKASTQGEPSTMAKNAMKMDTREFISYILSSEGAQKWMNEQVISEGHSLWTRFTDLLKDLIQGIANSLGLVDLNPDSLANLSLNEIQELLKAEKINSNIQKGDSYSDKVSMHLTEIRIQASEIGLLDDISNVDEVRNTYIKNNPVLFKDLVNEIAIKADVKPTQSSTSVKPTIDTSREWSGDLKTRPVYTPEGVNTMRTEVAKENEHFGNPFSEAGYGDTIKVNSIPDAVLAYKNWLTTNLEIVDRYTDADVKANPNKIYVFGDNTQRAGTGGQAQIRNNPNAIGIATKLTPSNAESAFMTDKDLTKNKAVIDEDIAKIKATGKDVVFPKDGLGTGLAKLKEKAPQTYQYLKQRLLEEFGFNNDTGMQLKSQQRTWILNQINQGKLDSATLLYAGKLAARGEGMHPTTLAEVVEQLRNNQIDTKTSIDIKTPIEGLNERLDNYGYARIVLSSDFNEGVRPKGRLNAFKEAIRLAAQNPTALMDINLNEFDFITNDEKKRLDALRPLAKEFQKTNLLISGAEFRTVAVEKRFAQLINQLTNEFVDIVGKHVEQQLGKTISSSKSRLSTQPSTNTKPIINTVDNSTKINGEEIYKVQLQNLKKYELFPDVFANEGQKEALDLLKDFLDPKNPEQQQDNSENKVVNSPNGLPSIDIQGDC